ncbi:MAG TPA: CPBP family intramembrane glutamic endopeptidase [Nitrospira sp.]|nr:CPBP family intramembrane glutamic endopeptidase [Nitrospira sp.]
MNESLIVTTQVSPPARSWWRETDAPPAVGPFPNDYSPIINWVSAVFLLASFAMVLVMASSTAKLDRFDAPEQALSLMVGRTMDAQEGQTRAPAWEQRIMAWISGDGAAERRQAITWYQELAAHSNDPAVPLQLAILQAESGQVSQALLSAHEWHGKNDPLPIYGDIIRAAYSEERPPQPDDVEALQGRLVDVLPVGWFYDRLMVRLALRAGHTDLAAVIQQQSDRRADRLYGYSRTLTAIELILMLLGSVCLLSIWRSRSKGSNRVRLHDPGIPPPWPGRVGAAVLLRGGAMGAIIMAFCLLYLPPENASLRALAIPLTNIPLLALAYYHLFRPAGMTFEEGFGLGLPWSALGRLMTAVLAVVAAGLWGEWFMDRLTEQWQLASHWTEWFDEDLVWGSNPLTMVSLLEYVILAPLFEELVFRGLLFAILRRKFRFLPAALISALMFGLAHGYGVVGLMSVCWSGVLWAWIYEKTGSLAPGILAHAINNFLVCLAVMALLRF